MYFQIDKLFTRMIFFQTCECTKTVHSDEEHTCDEQNNYKKYIKPERNILT